MDQAIEQYDIPPANYASNQHATHGFSHAPSAAQLASFLLIAYTVATYFSCLLPLSFNLPLLLLFASALATLVLTSAKASLTNPTDRVVYHYKWSRQDKKVSFSPDFRKVLYCQFCDSYCSASSKHCRACNRCVNRFDHHCMWFNNCVGERNYRYFFVSIISTFAYAVVFIAQVVLCSTAADYSDKGQLTKMVLGWIGALVMAVFAFLLFNLIALHCYLLATDQTTYQFLQRRKREEEEEKRKNSQAKASSQQKAADNKVTHISPPTHKVSSEESATKIAIAMKHDQQEDAKTDPRNRARSQKKPNGSGLRVSQNQNGVSKQLIFNEVESVQSKENDHQDAHQDQRPPQQPPHNHDRSLPSFFRKNKSLKLMFSEMQASSPLKPRNNFSDFAQRQS